MSPVPPAMSRMDHPFLCLGISVIVVVVVVVVAVAAESDGVSVDAGAAAGFAPGLRRRTNRSFHRR